MNTTYDLHVRFKDLGAFLFALMPRLCLQIKNAVTKKKRAFAVNTINAILNPKSLIGDEHLL